MIKTSMVALVIAFSLSTMSFATDKPHWSYSGQEGPAHWGELDKSFALCSTGKNQSPVNLTGMVEGELPELQLSYNAGGNEIWNNGHTIQVDYAPSSAMTVGERSFELKQFHFHSPSENTIEGKSYPMEAHFVHADEDGNLAVIAVLYEYGDNNTELEKAWAFMPEQSGAKHTLENAIDANNLLPLDQGYYRFNGSLTTPPCSEGVNWFVMKSFDTVSPEQVKKFTHAMHSANNRPVQPINARLIIK